MNIPFKKVNNSSSKNIKSYFKFLFKTIFILSFTFCFITLSVYFILLFKPLYYADIDILKIEESSTLDKKDLKANYDYVITYLIQNKNEEFNLPTLPSSANGKTHFKEVKVIFDKLKVMLSICIFISIIGVILNKKYKSIGYLITSSNVLLVIPVVLLIPFLINFDKSFTAFHHIFFNNDYWLFDVNTDPIITILPQEFFFHCAILIIFLIAISSITLRYIYKSQYKKLYSL